jgi:hypothetical protein
MMERTSYDRTAFDRYIEPPPRLASTPEALPYLGGLELSENQRPVADEIEYHPVTAFPDVFDDHMASDFLQRALRAPKARDRLNRGRVMPIGISRRGLTGKGERRTYLAVAYDYTANVAVEIVLDEQGEVLEVRDEHYQPPPIQSEIDRAIELARSDDRIATNVRTLHGMAIPFSGPHNEYADRRVIEVLFGCRAERVPDYRAWVDLATETVLHAGGTCECCDDDEQGGRQP